MMLVVISSGCVLHCLRVLFLSVLFDWAGVIGGRGALHGSKCVGREKGCVGVVVKCSVDYTR